MQITSSTRRTAVRLGAALLGQRQAHLVRGGDMGALPAVGGLVVLAGVGGALYVATRSK